MESFSPSIEILPFPLSFLKNSSFKIEEVEFPSPFVFSSLLLAFLRPSTETHFRNASRLYPFMRKITRKSRDNDLEISDVDARNYFAKGYCANRDRFSYPPRFSRFIVSSLKKKPILEQKVS